MMGLAAARLPNGGPVRRIAKSRRIGKTDVCKLAVGTQQVHQTDSAQARRNVSQESTTRRVLKPRQLLGIGTIEHEETRWCLAGHGTKQPVRAGPQTRRS